MRVFGPGISRFDYFITIAEQLASNNGVSLVPQNTPVVRAFARIRLCRYDGTFAFTFPDEFPNVVRGHIICVLRGLRTPKHVSYTPTHFPVHNMQVVTMHFCKSFLQNDWPDRTIGCRLGTNRFTIQHGDDIIDNNGLGHAQVEQVHNISALGLNHVPLGKDFLQPARSLCYGGCSFQVPVAVTGTFSRMLWNDTIVEDSCSRIGLGQMTEVNFVEIILRHERRVQSLPVLRPVDGELPVKAIVGEAVTGPLRVQEPERLVARLVPVRYDATPLLIRSVHLLLDQSTEYAC